MNIPCIAYKSILSALFNFLLLVKTQIVPHFIFQPGIPESQGSTRGLTKAWKEKILSFNSLSRINSIFCHDVNEY